MAQDILQQVKAKAQRWLDGNYDEQTKAEIRAMLENDQQALVDAFYKDLEFGTGGLRGIMGAGTNRLNIYTVGMATQGLCNYMKQNFGTQKQLKVAIAYDCRNNGALFAQTAAGIFSANGMKVYLFDALRPTPELSFAIRHLGCQSGVVITASHNPKEYNGFKAYWDDGGQLIAPHDQNVVAEARKITDIAEVKFDGPKENIETIGDEIDKAYIQELKKLSLSPQLIEKQSDIKIVYTPIHGTGVKLVPLALKAYGFKNIYNVPEQDETNGNFPTVVSPNPENAEALELALKKAEEKGADLVMATDPDADRVGIAVRNDKGNLELLNGNQTAALLIYYLASQWSAKGKLEGKEYMVKTIVTTELLWKIADKFGIEHFDVLTGFKYIADLIKQNQGTKTFIGGGEESYGYLAGEFVRDKDAVMSCALIAETAAWAQEQGKNLFELLLDIYVEFGFYKEKLINLVKKGKAGADQIQQMMDNYRQKTPEKINGSKIDVVKDYLLGKETNKTTGKEKNIDLPKSNVLQFFLADGSKISIRPSGTEPKIKFYFSVNDNLAHKTDYQTVNQRLDQKIENIISDMNIQ